MSRFIEFVVIALLSLLALPGTDQAIIEEAAKLAPRRNPDLALVYADARQKVNANWATLAVARKLVAYLMAVDREQRDFQPMRGLAGTAA